MHTSLRPLIIALAAVAAVACLGDSGAVFAQCSLDKIVASDAAGGDLFGEAVAIDGDYAVVGARCDSDAGTCSGSAYVFHFDGTDWTQQAKLTASDAASIDLFGESVALDGDWAVVSARLDDDDGGASGAAYVFRRDGTTWVEQQKLVAWDASAGAGAGDQFGFPLVIDGDLIAIAARLDDETENDSGSVYMFVRDDAGTPGDASDDSWVAEQKLTAPVAVASAFFGEAVDLDGSTLVVGARADDDGANPSGAAVVFTRDGQAAPPTWSHEATLTAAGAAADDRFGWSVAISGETAVVGAHHDADAGAEAGAVYVFDRVGTTWTESAKHSACETIGGDEFARAVSMDGDRFVVGARGFDGPGPSSGAAYVFDRSGGVWFQSATLTACDAAEGDEFGCAVAVRGDRAMFGARHDDDAGSNSGSAHIADLAGATSADCNANGQPDACEIATGALDDCNSNGIPDVCEIDAATEPLGTYFCLADCDPDCNANGIPDDCETVLVPVITSQPIDRTVCEGDPVTIDVESDGDSLTYQWSHDGQPLTDGGGISGATTAALTIDVAAVADSGAYSVEVTNGCGTTTSDAATLTVLVEANCVAWEACCFDSGGCLYLEPADCLAADGTPQGVTTTCAEPVVFTTQPVDASACEADAVSFTVSVIAVDPAFQWRKDGNDIVGATADTFSIASADAADTGAYDVIVTTLCGPYTSATATLTVGVGPSIATQPSDASVCDGAAVTLTVVVDPGTTVTYQWRFDSVDISGATDVALALDPVSTTDAGMYDVVVTAACGSVTSDAATLSVNAGPTITTQPADQAVCTGDAINLVVDAGGGASLTYQWRKDGGDIEGATASTFDIAAAVIEDAGVYDVAVTDECASITSDPATITVDESPSCQTEACCLLDGVCVQTTVDDCLAQAGTAQGPETDCATADCPQPSGACCLDNGNCLDLIETDCAVIPGGNWQGPQTDCAGTPCPDPVVACCFPPTGCLTLTAEECALAGGDAQGSGTTCANPVSIVAQPSDATACIGDAVMFSVQVDGAGLSYQWRLDGGDIPGETGTTLTIASVATGDAGVYDVVIDNACGSAISDAATLVVNTSVEITASPESAVICEGDSITLSVVATGDALSYQWFKDGADLPGAIEATYAIEAATTGDAGAYDVLVSNPCGSQFSDMAQIDVDAAPIIIQQPSSVGACEGGGVTLSVEDDGAGAYSYQWRRDGTDIDGAIASSYDITTLAPETEGSYDVRIDNGVCSIISDAAVIDCTFGACCDPLGTCTDDLLEPDCASQGGAYQGDDSTCGATACPQPQGACCLDPSGCVILLEADCLVIPNAAWAGPDTSCADCPKPMGACCLDNGNCLVIIESDCDLITGSRWAGPDTICTDADLDGYADDCVAGPADIDTDGDLDADDITAFTLALLGEPLDPSHTARSDLDGDGLANGADVASFIAAFLDG